MPQEMFASISFGKAAQICKIVSMSFKVSVKAALYETSMTLTGHGTGTRLHGLAQPQES